MGRDIQTFKDLIVWQKAIALCSACYRLTAQFPKEELYGLTTQIRRSSVSIAANIAEGHGRENTGSFIQFLRVAQGSLKELETHLIIAKEVELVDNSRIEPHLDAIDQIGRMLRSLIRSLREHKDFDP